LKILISYFLLVSRFDGNVLVICYIRNQLGPPCFTRTNSLDGFYCSSFKSIFPTPTLMKHHVRALPLSGGFCASGPGRGFEILTAGRRLQRALPTIEQTPEDAPLSHFLVRISKTESLMMRSSRDLQDTPFLGANMCCFGTLLPGGPEVRHPINHRPTSLSLGSTSFSIIPYGNCRRNLSLLGLVPGLHPWIPKQVNDLPPLTPLTAISLDVSRLQVKFLAQLGTHLLIEIALISPDGLYLRKVYISIDGRLLFDECLGRTRVCSSFDGVTYPVGIL